jgi:hypothetical protein
VVTGDPEDMSALAAQAADVSLLRL